MAKKGQTFKKYSPEFKLSVILDMREHKLSYHETMRKYFPHLTDSKNFSFLLKWERKYLEEGIEGLSKENRGRPTVNGKKRGRPPKLDKQVEEDLKVDGFLKKQGINVQTVNHKDYANMSLEELMESKELIEDLIAENQRLRMEIEYLKKLSALVLAEEQKNGKRPK